MSKYRMGTGKNIVLIGMMGSGKTTVGQLLAQHSGYTFVDLDQEVEKRVGMSIGEIFSQQGEETFRDLETKVVQYFSKGQKQVIATGGGVVLRQENIVNLKRQGFLIFLYASLETLSLRLKGHQERPLLEKVDRQIKIKELLNQRLSLYQRAADITLEVDERTPPQVVNDILKKTGMSTGRRD